MEVYNFKTGPMDSPMTVDNEKNFPFLAPEKVVQIIVRALANKRYEIYVPGYWAWVMLMVHLLPESVFQRLAFLSVR